MAQTFLDKAKAAASNLAANAKAAGQIAAKQSERVKITQVTLPSAYLALGSDIHAAGRFRDEFGDRYAKADDLLVKIAKLRQAQPAPTEPQKLTDRAKSAAGHAKDWTTAKALDMETHSVLRELAKSAFEAHGDQSGPSQLTSPIAGCLSRIAALDAEISQLSESHKGAFLTPKRVLVGGVAVCGLVVLLVVGSMFSVGFTPRKLANRHHLAEEERAGQEPLDKQKLVGDWRNVSGTETLGFTKGGTVIWTRSKKGDHKEARYSVSASALKIAFPNSIHPEPFDYRIEFTTNDEIVLSGTESEVVYFGSLGGKWRRVSFHEDRIQETDDGDSNQYTASDDGTEGEVQVQRDGTVTSSVKQDGFSGKAKYNADGSAEGEYDFGGRKMKVKVGADGSVKIDQ